MLTAQILFAEYLTPLPHAAPLDGSLFLSEIDTETEPDAKNDLRFILAFSGNATNLEKTNISVSVVSDDLPDDAEPAKIVSLEGKHSTYEIVVRPQFPLSDIDDISGELTITLAENAVNETNPETTATFRYSNTIPEAAWQDVFTTTQIYEDIVAVTRDRVILLFQNALHFFTPDGNPLESEQITFPDTPTVETVARYAEQKYLGLSTDDNIGYLLDAGEALDWESADIWMLDERNIVDWALDAESKRLVVSNLRASSEPNFASIPMALLHNAIQKGDDLSDFVFDNLSLDNGDVEVEWSMTVRIAADRGKLYIASNESGLNPVDNFVYPYDTDGTLIPSGRMLIPDTSNTLGIFVFENYLYRYAQNKHLTKVDLSTVALPRPLASIYPMTIKPGDRIDLRKFCRYANDIVFEVGFDKPEWLSIVDNRWLVIAEDVDPESTALLRLRGINQNGITDENAFYFHIFVEKLRTPAWKAFDRLNMFADQKLDMFAYCENADKIEWKHGATLPTDIASVDGVIQVTGDAFADSNPIELRASTLQGTFEDISFTLNIFSADRVLPLKPTDAFRFRILIGGVEVSANDVIDTSNINASLDLKNVNVFKRGEATINLNSRGGYYNSEFADNFWQANNLNQNGHLNSVEIYLEYLQDNTWQTQRILFEGLILNWDESIKNIQVTLSCVDASYFLRQIQIAGSGHGISKLAALFPPTNAESEPVKEGVYTPDTSLVPLNLDKQAKAWVHAESLELKDVVNQPETMLDRKGFLSDADLKTQGGFLEDALSVLLQFRTNHRNRKASALVDALAKLGRVYSVDTNFEAYVKDAHISTNGNIAFNTESGRITRLPVSWLHDDTNNLVYVLLSNSSNTISDELVVYDIEKDIYRVLESFDPSLAVLQLATTDFDTFYILAAPAIDAEVDRSAADVDTDTIALGYDSAEAAKSRILQYVHSDDWTMTLVDTDSDFPPQVGLHYWVGFENIDHLWQGIQPTSRANFQIHNNLLYYRFATAEKFGVAAVDTDGNTQEIVSADRDGYMNHLNFAFDIDANGEVFFAYSQGTPTDSKLVIESSTGERMQRRELISNLTVLDEIGGAWLGVHELLVHDGFCYLIVPIARNNRDMDKSAGAVLYRWAIGAYQIEAIETYDFVHWGATSLIVHDGAIHFLESPDVSYKFPPRNPDLESWDTETEQNILPDAKGYLKRVEHGVPSPMAESLGNVWFDENAFRGTPMQMLSFNDALHFVMAEDIAENVLQRNSLASEPTNFQWLTYGKKLNFRFDPPTSGSVYEALVDIATKTYATFSMDRNIISIKNRNVAGALVDGAVTSGDATITYDNANKTFPASGYLRINDEIIKYTARTSTAFSGLERGANGTTPAAHADNTEILFLHRVLDQDMLSGDVSIGLHWEHLYNVVQDSNFRVKKSDASSLDMFGERALDIGLNLNEHKVVWLEFLVEQYLEQFKDTQHLLRLDLQPNPSIRLGDIIGFNYAGELLFSLKVMDITYGLKASRIIGRQVAVNIKAAPELPALDPNETFRTTDGDGMPLLVAGNGDVALFWGDVRNAIPKAPAFASDASIPNQQWTQFERITPVQMPALEDEGHGEVKYELIGADDEIYLDERLRIVGIPQLPQSATRMKYRATDIAGVSVELAFDATVSATSRESRRTTDGNNAPLLVAGSGDVALFRA